MGNIASQPIAAYAAAAEIKTIFVIGSDPVEILADLTDKLTAAALEPEAFALNDISIGGTGQGQKFCVTATLSPNPGGEPYTFAFYLASSEDELQNAYQTALAELVANIGVAAYDLLGNTVVGSSDGKRFFGMLLARRQEV